MSLYPISIPQRHKEKFRKINFAHNRFTIPVFVVYMLVYSAYAYNQAENISAIYIIALSILSFLLFCIYLWKKTNDTLREVCLIIIMSSFVIFNYFLYLGYESSPLLFYFSSAFIVYLPLSSYYESVLYLIGNMVAYSIAANVNDTKTGVMFTILAIMLYVYKENMRKTGFTKEQANNEQNAELLKLNAELEKLSETDPLTTLLNRRAFEKYMAISYEYCQRNNLPLTVFMLDIDHFKLYNDTYGHVKGDECLKIIANVIKTTFKRSSDIVARYGGEEFIVATPNASEDHILELCEELRSAVETLMIKHQASPTSPYTTISIGVASRIPSNRIKAMDIISLADNALYEAKHLGRNRSVSDINIEKQEIKIAPRNPIFKLPGIGEDLEKLQTVLKHDTMFIFAIDAETGRFEISEEVKNYIDTENTTFDSLEGLKPFIYHEDYPLLVKESMDMLNGEFTPDRLPVRVLGKDGKYRWIALLASFLDNDGRGQIIGSAIDYEDQMYRQKRIDLVAEGSDSYVFIYEFDINKMVLNKYFTEAMGLETQVYNLDENYCHQILIDIFGDEYKKILKAIRDCSKKITKTFKDCNKNNEQAFELTVNVNKPLDSKGVFHIRGMVSHNEFGEFYMVAGSMTDITELVAQREKNKMLLLCSEECLFVYDSVHDIIDFNTKINEYINISSLSIAKNELIQYIHNDDIKVCINEFSKIVDNNIDVHSCRIRLKNPSGNYIWVLIKSNFRQDANNKIIYATGSISLIKDTKDINESKIVNGLL